MKRRTDTERLEIISPSQDEHAEEIIDLCAKVFSGPADYYVMRRDVSYHLLEQGQDWRVSRIGLLDGRLVTNWTVIAYTMRIGRARVRVGGVSCVATDAEYRKRGLMRPTGLASIDAMRTTGYDMTILFGIPDYYDRYGYVNAWPEMSSVIKTSLLPAVRRPVRLRPFSPRYLDELTTLYNRSYARCTGTAVRSAFPKPHRDLDWRQLLWVDGTRRPAGYIVVQARGDTLTCHGHAGDPQHVLFALRQLADEAKCHHVRFLTLHGATPLAARLRRETCRITTSYTRCGDAMVQTLNLRSTLGKMGKELSRRLKRSPAAGWRGELLIADPREKVMLKIRRGDVVLVPPARTKHAIRGGEAIARLVLGSDESDAVIDGGGIRTTGDARMLARVLFPYEHPELCNLDRY